MEEIIVTKPEFYFHTQKISQIISYVKIDT